MKQESLQQLLSKTLIFFKERDWEKYHSPKNLLMDLTSEVGELVEHFRWLTEEQSYHLSEKTKQEVCDEVGDVFLVLIYLCHKLGIDPIECSEQKLEKTAQKYPVSLCHGKCDKYTNYIK